MKKREHFYFSLLTFLFFKNSERRRALFFGHSRIVSWLVTIPYILAMEIAFLRRRRYFVKLNSQIVGMCILSENSDSLHISGLAVVPEYRNLGIATFILDFASRVAERLNKKWLELDVLRTNTPALKLYEKYGFTMKTKRRWRFIMKKKVGN
jgi:ribosomal protein S18 acetylase RimI-like enzyme